MWVLAGERGDASPDHRISQAPAGRASRVYAGPCARGAQRQTCVDIARLQGGQSLDVDKPALVYVCDGRGFADEDTVSSGTLLRSDQLTFDATEDTCLVIVHEETC
jgi:hypothetical protein